MHEAPNKYSNDYFIMKKTKVYCNTMYFILAFCQASYYKILATTMHHCLSLYCAGGL
jgi:hypothetical protein